MILFNVKKGVKPIRIAILVTLVIPLPTVVRRMSVAIPNWIVKLVSSVTNKPVNATRIPDVIVYNAQKIKFTTPHPQTASAYSLKRKGLVP